MQILGILNVTRDSFSDGGQFLDPADAITHGLELARAGADFVDVGAESTHPDAEDVPAELEINRLTPVVQALKTAGVRISVDAYKPAVFRAMLALGVDLLNDVTALADPEARAVARTVDVPIVLMHSVTQTPRAARVDVPPEAIVAHVVAFFERRLAELEAEGFARDRFILDPGMGFFLSSNPVASVAMLRGIPRLRALGLPVCISTSRKSFVGALTADATGPRLPAQRGAGTLATELWSLHAGAQYIRTHDPRALRDAAQLWSKIAAAPDPH